MRGELMRRNSSSRKSAKRKNAAAQQTNGQQLLYVYVCIVWAIDELGFLLIFVCSSSHTTAVAGLSFPFVYLLIKHGDVFPK
jgi:hypothetical protein